MNQNGKILWEKPHLGYPVFLDEQKNIVVINDDDSDPDVAFRVYDFSGNLKFEAKLDEPIEPVDYSIIFKPFIFIDGI